MRSLPSLGIDSVYVLADANLQIGESKLEQKMSIGKNNCYNANNFMISFFHISAAYTLHRQSKTARNNTFVTLCYGQHVANSTIVTDVQSLRLCI